MKFSNGSRVGWVFVHRLMPLVRIPIVGVLFAFGLLVSTPCFPQGNAIRLVSDEEARLPDGRAATTRAITRGPGLKLISPADVVGKAFPVNVQFERRGGVALDLKSFKIEYLKEPVIDITERVRAKVNADTLEIPVAALPPGEHHFRMSLKDVDGRTGTALFSIKAR